MHKAAERFKEESLGVFLLRDQCGSMLAANGLFTLRHCGDDNGSFSKELKFTKTLLSYTGNKLKTLFMQRDIAYKFIQMCSYPKSQDN